MPPLGKSKTKTKDTDKEEDNRMWASVVFVIILFVIGIPLWWHLTTVERVELPTSRIERLNSTSIFIRTNISIITNDEKTTKSIVTELNQLLVDTDILKFTILEGKLNKKIDLNPEVLEKTLDVHPTSPGVYQFVLCPTITSNKVLFGTHRTMYFSKNVDTEQLSEVIKEYLLQEKLLIQAKEAITTPGYILKPQDKETARRIRLSSSYDLIFTIIVPDPEQIQVEWDFLTMTQGYLQPMLDQLSAMSNYSVKSQWLYHVDLEQKPKKLSDGYSISQKQMSHIVSTLEKKLGTYASSSPCLHFIIYTTECRYVPMYFMNNDDDKSQSIISNRWGTIQIVNPNEKENCNTDKIFKPDPHPIMTGFLNDFKQLIGVKRQDTMTGIDRISSNAALLTQWEIDVLFRIRTIEQFASSKLTLSSLIQLLDQIGNIVINSQVGDAVYSAVDSAEQAEIALELGQLDNAMIFSRESYNKSELAFTHPTLLALLYFPDDQKYAVYIPLFLPVMIPVLLSLTVIVNWIRKKVPANLLSQFQLPCIPDQTQLYDDDKIE